MNTNTPFGQLINYEGRNMYALRQYAIAHSGNLIFAHITNSSGEFYYIYANSVEMKIPTLEQFNYLKNYVGTIPEGYSATNIVDFIKEYVKEALEWAKIGE